MNYQPLPQSHYVRGSWVEDDSYWEVISVNYAKGTFKGNLVADPKHPVYKGSFTRDKKGRVICVLMEEGDSRRWMSVRP